MKRYSQNKEQDVIFDYFHVNKLSGKRSGTFLDIGCNDMITLSNTRALSEVGWRGVGVEPSLGAFMKAMKNCESLKVALYNVAIGTETGKMKFWESGTHLKKGDTALLSTLKESEIDRWRETEQFTETEVDVMSWEDFHHACGLPHYDFVSIDAEGFDIEILEQMDLDVMGTSMVCIEWNGVPANMERISAKLKGWKLIHKNRENLIYVR